MEDEIIEMSSEKNILKKQKKVIMMKNAWKKLDLNKKNIKYAKSYVSLECKEKTVAKS